MAQTPAVTRLSPLGWVGLAAGAAVLAIAYMRTAIVAPDAERFTFDSAEYALAGRAWLDTGRLATPFVHPAVLGVAPGPPFPLVAGHPLVPALDALAFAVAGRTEDATLLPPLLAFVACVLLVARLALGLSNSRAAALGAAAAFAVSPWALAFATEGRSEMPFAELLTGALLLLSEFPRAGPRLRLGGAPLAFGVTLGMAHLARPVVAPLLPAVALGVWLLSPPGRRVRFGLLALAGFVPLAVLTLLYKWASIGHPFFDVGGYLLLAGIAPEWSVTRLNRMTPPPDALAWIGAHSGRFAVKLARNLPAVVLGAWGHAGRWSGALAALGTAVALARGARAARALALVLVIMLVLLAMLAAATVADPRMLFPLLPSALALGFAALARLAEPLGSTRRRAVVTATLLAVSIAAMPLARAWRSRVSGARARPALPEGAPTASEWRELGAHVAPLLPPGELVASDAAPWIAWHTGRPVTLVPLEPAQLVDWPARWQPAAVVLTNEWLVWQPLETSWRRLLERDEPPAGYRLAGRVRAGRLEAVVFTRSAAP